MNHEDNFTVREATWSEDGDALLVVRTTVFVREQGVDIALERDGTDGGCWHVLAISVQGEPIGAGRLASSGKVGRVAVLSEWRGRGVGSALMRSLLERANEESLEAYLHSQVDATAFYEGLGFESTGKIFDEAGIHHVRMVRRGAGDR
jgi:predicted GNAT family N-acyltransferase